MTGERVKAIISEQLDISIEEIFYDSVFVDDLGLDSVDTENLLYTIGDEFGVNFEESGIDEYSTVKDVIDYIEENQEY